MTSVAVRPKSTLTRPLFVTVPGEDKVGSIGLIHEPMEAQAQFGWDTP